MRRHDARTCVFFQALTRSGGALIVSKDGQTTVYGVFAAGDVVTGPRTVVEAAAGMLHYMGLNRQRSERHTR